MKIKKIILSIGMMSNLVYANENSISLALINNSSIYKTKEDVSVVLPVLNYTKNAFYIEGYEVGYKLNSMVSFLTQVNFNSVDMDGIDDRDATIEAGMKLTYENKKNCKITFKTVFDTLNKHSGYQSVLNFEKTFIYNKFSFIPNIGLEYQDKNYSDYYFGVDKHERYSQYQLKSTLNKTIGVITRYTIDKDWSLNFVYTYKKLDKDISNSSIINKDYSQMTALSVSYKF